MVLTLKIKKYIFLIHFKTKNTFEKIFHKKYKNYYQNVLEILGRHKRLYNSVISELEAETKS
jgi:hypothetical protein